MRLNCRNRATRRETLRISSASPTTRSVQALRVLGGVEAATAEQWADWRWQSQHAVSDVEGLKGYLRLSEEEVAGVARAFSGGLPIAITPYYLSLCDAGDPQCPIRRQCVPVAAEGVEVEGDLRDPLGEEEHEVAPHLIQRYPDRALMVVTDRCAVYCRFCTRSRLVGAGGGVRSLSALEPAFDYLKQHPQIQEVILSGGDPLVMSDERIGSLLDRLAGVDSLLNLRIGTRAPVTLPQRIDAALCRALRRHPSVWIMTHFNHPKELSAEAQAACARLADAGLPVMNQTVLLRGINDNAATLENLFRGLVRNRVRPYYLLQADPVRGTSHMRTPLATGLRLMEELQGKLSGIALPKFIVDTPGGRGKVPLSPQYIVERQQGATLLRTFRGEQVRYIDPPLHEAPASSKTAPSTIDPTLVDSTAALRNLGIQESLRSAVNPGNVPTP